jgi:fructosamine-3-kinase
MPDTYNAGDSDSFVPASESEVAASWLQDALSDVFQDVQIRAVQTERVGEGYGLASRIFRYGWQGGEQINSVVVKLWSTDSLAGEREIHFFHQFGSARGARIPVCYHAAVDRNGKRGVLVLEDLEPVEQGDDLQQLPLDRAQLLAQSLAGMHARWMRSHDLEGADWLRVLYPWEPEVGWFASRRTVFLERFSDRLTHTARSLLNQIEYAPAVSNERLITAPNTLLHADLHLDNIVFERDGNPVILDWANCARGPAASDVYRLLFGISQPQDIEPVLSTYLNSLEHNSGEHIDAEIFHHQLGGVFLHMFAIGTCGVARWQPTSKREAAMIDNGIQRTHFALEYWLEKDPALFYFLK